MGRCRFRPVTYRIGLALLVMGFLLVAFGFAAPAWISRSGGGSHGLWHWCDRDWTSCRMLPHMSSYVTAIVMVVRGLLAASLFFYLVSFAMALRENCCSPNFYTCCLAGRKTEVFAFVAEILGIAGMVLYSVMEYEQSHDFRRLSWAHALCDGGLVVSLIGSIMMACAQQTLPAAKAAAGRIVANPLGYETLANNRSASLHSRSTQPSPFQGRTTPVISGPYPSPATAAAANSMVSPKQNRSGTNSRKSSNGTNGRKSSNGGRNNGTPTSPQPKKQTPQNSPYPTLDSQNSPSRRRKSSGQGKQFAGVHNQGKHPPVFASQHVQEEWSAHQGGVFTEQQDIQDPDVRTQRALKAQMEQHQRQGHAELTRTWSSEDERSRLQHSHSVQLQHQENQYRSHTQMEQRITSHNLPASMIHNVPHTMHHHHNPPHGMPPPPKPPKPSGQYVQQEHPGMHHNYPQHNPEYVPQHNPEYVTQHNPEYVVEGSSSLPRRTQDCATGYQYPTQGYIPEHGGDPQLYNSPQQYSQQQQLPPPQHHQNQRPDSGNFPDPPPPEQLLCYEGDPQYPSADPHQYGQMDPRQYQHADPSQYQHGDPHQYPQMDPRQYPMDPQYYPEHEGVPAGGQYVMVQPMVMYRAPSQPGQSPVTETVAIRAHDPHQSPHHSPHPQHQQYQQLYHQQQLHDQRLLQQQLQQHGQTFPRQTPPQHHDYSTFSR